MGQGSRAPRLRRLCALLLLPICLLATGLFHSSPRSHTPLPQSVYIWQRAWTPAVRDAAASHSPAFASVIPLSAEIAWDDNRPYAVRTHPSFSSIPAATPIGLALRINSHPTSAPDPSAFLTDLAQDLLSEARAAGREPIELELDFDCPTSKLAKYRDWVRTISAAVSPTPVILTALPAWLSSPDFAPLARASSGFILQVHSLDRPRLGDPTLCDTNHARRWVERAARLNIPFRVALPTYAYLAAYDDKGRLIGITAESESPSTVATFREVRADPVALAHLVRTWQSDHPASMTGLIWYRLPTEADTLNWSWPTFAAVMQGRTPAPNLSLSARQSEPGLYELLATNTGNADTRIPAAITARWTSARLIAADGLANFQADAAPDQALHFINNATLPPNLPPDTSIQLGWIRLDHPAEISLDAPR